MFQMHSGLDTLEWLHSYMWRACPSEGGESFAGEPTGTLWYLSSWVPGLLNAEKGIFRPLWTLNFLDPMIGLARGNLPNIILHCFTIFSHPINPLHALEKAWSLVIEDEDCHATFVQGEHKIAPVRRLERKV